MRAQREERADSAWGAGVPQRDVMDLLSRVLRGKPDSLGRVLVETAKATGGRPAAFLLGQPGLRRLPRRLGQCLHPPRAEATTNATTVGASVSFTTKKQFNVVVRSNIFGNSNRFLLQGDWRYLDTSQPTYGLGPALPESQKDDIDFNLVRVYQTFYRPLTGRLLGGVGYHLNAYFNIRDHNAEPGLPSPILEFNGGQTITRTPRRACR